MFDFPVLGGLCLCQPHRVPNRHALPRCQDYHFQRLRSVTANPRAVRAHQRQPTRRKSGNEQQGYKGDYEPAVLFRPFRFRPAGPDP